MYHLKLIKGQSYIGVVEASKENPDVYVEEEAVAYQALASGYFVLTEETKFDKTQLGEMKLDSLKKLAADMGLDVSNLKRKGDLIEAIIAAKEKQADVDPEENEVDYGEGSQTMIELQRQ